MVFGFFNKKNNKIEEFTTGSKKNIKTKKPRATMKSLLQFANGKNNPFIDWPNEAIVRQLEADGLHVPPDVNTRDLMTFANEFYEGKPIPEKPKEDETVYTSRKGVQYMLRPPRFQNLNKNKDEVESDRFFDGYLYAESQSYLPPMNEAEANAGVSREYTTYIGRSDELNGGPMVSTANGTKRPVSTDSELENYWLGVNETEKARKQSKGGILSKLSKRDRVISKAEIIRQQDSFERPNEIIEEYGFMKDTNVTEERIRKEFQLPSKETALYYADLNHLRKRDGNKYSVCNTNTGRHCFSLGCFGCIFDPFCEGSSSDLRRYGAGVSLYFKFLKWGFWTFFILSILSIPQLVLNFGDTGAEDFNNGNGLFVFSLGHVSQSAYGLDTNFTLSDLAENVGINVTSTVATIIRDESLDDVVLPFITDMFNQPYTISKKDLGIFYVTNDLVILFVFLMSIYWLRSYEHDEHIGAAKRHISIDEYTIQVVRVPRDVNEFDLAGFFGDITEEPIADVAIAQDNGELIDLYVRRGKVLNKLWKESANVHLLRNSNRNAPAKCLDKILLNRKINQSIRYYDRLYAQYVYLTKLIDETSQEQQHSDSLSGFVTFETQAGYLKALDLYPPGRWAKSRQKEELQFKGMKIRVRQAPPPSTIKWENYGYDWNQRLQRRYISIFFTIVALSLSVLATFLAERFRESLSTDNQLICELPSNNNATIINQYFNQIKLNEDIDNIPEAYVDCYCHSLDYASVVNAISQVDNPCNSYYSDLAMLYGFSFIATFVISIINIILEFVIQKFAVFEKHHSIINMELSVAKRIFVALILNTAFILLLANASFLGGLYSDFTRDWYSNVGSQILLAMILNIFSFHSYRLFQYLYYVIRRKYYKPNSQREMNELYLGPRFQLSLRIAQTLATIFITLLYAPGMPILYLICCIFFFIYYWVDKFLLLKFYRTPPHYSNRLSYWASKTLTWSIFIHLLFASWIYSASGIFIANDKEGSSFSKDVGDYFFLGTTEVLNIDFGLSTRLTLDHIIPLYVLIVIFMIYKFLKFIALNLEEIMLTYCGCCFQHSSRSKKRYLNPNFTDARVRGELRGLDTYNILRNPIYARSFQTNDAFANNHRHVGSIRKAKSPITPTQLRSAATIMPRNSDSSDGSMV